MILVRAATSRQGAEAALDRLEAAFGGAAVSASLAERPDGRWSAELLLADGEVDGLATTAKGALEGIAGIETSVETLPERDWVAESLKGLAPVRAGLFIVHGAHDRSRVPPSRFRIEVEAAQAFGTGHHGTTAGCLAALAGLAGRRRVRRALDLGTGSGVLAIALAKLGVGRVIASDIDPLAVAETRTNARHNGVAHRVEAVLAHGIPAPAIRAHAPYDLIVANILAGPLIRLAPAIVPLLGLGAPLVLSGLLETQRSRVVAAYGAMGLALRTASGRDGWSILILERPITTGRR